MKKVIFPGSFDPITKGHIDLITRALGIFDEVIVLIADNNSKKSLFSLDEKKKIITDAIYENKLNNVKVDYTDTLITSYAKEHNIFTFLRGIRNTFDFENEIILYNFNKELNKEMETIFLFPSLNKSYISSSAIKELAKSNVELNKYLPTLACKMIKEKLKDL